MNKTLLDTPILQDGTGTDAGTIPVFDIAVQGIAKTFDKTHRVLDDITFTVPRGQIVSLIGSNGCGKSTLLRCLIGLVKPDNGSISVLGQDVIQGKYRHLRSLRSRVGFIFQRHNLVPRLSALTNVIHGQLATHSSPFYWYQAFAPARVRKKAMQCLERVGLAHLAMRRADKLSGGESQRVAIARALMQEPSLILADEPVASLDPRVGMETMELFVELARTLGITLVFVSHDLEHACCFADRLIAIRKGRIVLDREGSDIDKSELKQVYG
jgi:phosphonate transport system ATP-binding protein